jgi:hypothetical protein
LEVAFIGLLAVAGKPSFPSVLPDRRTARAVERVRAEEALAAARRLYTASAFDQCSATLIQAEARFRTLLARRSDFEAMKQINLWLGLCLAVSGDPDAAGVAFARARRLPGAGPNPDLFPPEILDLTEPRGEIAECELTIDARMVDGKRVARGEELEIGDHYATGARTGRFTLDEDCAVSWAVDASPPAGVLTKREAADPDFRARLAKQGVSLELEPKRKVEPEPPWYQEHWWIWVVAGVVTVAVAVPTTWVLTRDAERQ